METQKTTVRGYCTPILVYLKKDKYVIQYFKKFSSVSLVLLLLICLMTGIQMVKSINISSPGEVNVMEFKDKPLGKPSETEVAVQHKAIGLNFIDIYQ